MKLMGFLAIPPIIKVDEKKGPVGWGEKTERVNKMIVLCLMKQKMISDV